MSFGFLVSGCGDWRIDERVSCAVGGVGTRPRRVRPRMADASWMRPCRYNSGLDPPDIRPFIRFGHKILTNRILDNVIILLHPFCIVAYPMIEEITLPTDPISSRCNTLPRRNNPLHRFPHRKVEQAMYMIWHHKKQNRKTSPNSMVSFPFFPESRCYFRHRQNIEFPCFCMNSKEVKRFRKNRPPVWKSFTIR